MIKQILKLGREYRDTKEEIVEKSVNDLEASTQIIYLILFVALISISWLNAIFSEVSFGFTIFEFGISFIIYFFTISYFAVYIGSKYFFRPTYEEVSDDTSMFALFSASENKVKRFYLSIGFSILHTFTHILFLINNDLDIVEFFK